MADTVKQRLLGALVLISLAVIFLPMILDAENGPQSEIEKGEIPPIPENLKVQALPLPENLGKVDEKDFALDLTGLPLDKNTNTPAASSLKKKTQTTNKLTPNKPTSWVVQIASYSVKKNALALVKKLNKKGFKATISAQRNRKGAFIYRVEIGPHASKALAATARDKVERKMSLNAIIISRNKTEAKAK